MAIIKKRIPNNNLNDYLKSFYLSFDEAPLNELDCAFFSKLSYYDFSVYKKKEMKIKDLYNLKYISDYLGSNVKSKHELNMFMYACGNPRFKDVKITNFENKINNIKTEQFFAVTFQYKKMKIIAYRGTLQNIDGWKESFNLSYMFPIPSQISGLKYLKKESRSKKYDYYLTGHSKGGNLALYAYLNLRDSQKAKVKNIYTFDAPGLENMSFDNLKANQTIKKYIPVCSVIGMIFDNPKHSFICKSDVSFLKQHEIFNWKVDLENNRFYYERTLNPRFAKFNAKFTDYIVTKSLEDREFAVNFLFKLIKNVKSEDNGEVSLDLKTSIRLLRIEYQKESDEVRKKARTMLSELINVVIKGMI